MVNAWKTILPEGKYTLSGVDKHTQDNDWGDVLEYTLLCLNNKTYGFAVDPDDGYRSYSSVVEFEEKSGVKCDYPFAPQEVILSYEKRDNDIELLILRDAKNNKVILECGTCYAENYYPYAVFNYMPENLWVNEIQKMIDEDKVQKLADFATDVVMEERFGKFYTDCDDITEDKLMSDTWEYWNEKFYNAFLRC